MPEIRRYQKCNYTEHDWNYFYRQFSRELDDAKERLARHQKTNRKATLKSIPFFVVGATAIGVACIIDLFSVWLWINAAISLVVGVIIVTDRVNNNNKIVEAKYDIKVWERNIEEWLISDSLDHPFKDNIPIPVESKPMQYQPVLTLKKSAPIATPYGVSPVKTTTGTVECSHCEFKCSFFSKSELHNLIDLHQKEKLDHVRFTTRGF